MIHGRWDFQRSALKQFWQKWYDHDKKHGWTFDFTIPFIKKVQEMPKLKNQTPKNKKQTNIEKKKVNKRMPDSQETEGGKKGIYSQ